MKKRSIIACLFFLLCAFFITYPLVFHLSTFVTGYGDELFITWTQNWVIHSLLASPVSLLNAPIFYPLQNTLAFSDLHLTTSTLALPVYLLFKQPLVTFNFTVITSLWLVGFASFLISYCISKNFLVSLLSGVLVIFSPVLLDKKIQIQLLAVEFVPLSVLCFLLFLDRQRTSYLVGSLAFFVLQALNSFMPAYFIIFADISITIYYLLSNKKILTKLCLPKHILLLVLSLGMLILVALPYYRVSSEYHYTRDLRDTIHFALQPEDLLFPSGHSRLEAPLMWLQHQQDFPKSTEYKTGYIGAIFLLLTIFSIGYYFRTAQKKGLVTTLFLISIVGLVLSFGPFLHIARKTIHHPFPIPLPYVLFYYILPGFKGFRNSSRFEVMFVLFLAPFIAYTLSDYLKRKTAWLRRFVPMILILFTVLEFRFPMQFYSVPRTQQFPHVYQWLLSIPQNTGIVELPIYNWNMTPYAGQEIMREYFNTNSFIPRLNGFSGFFPKGWQDVVTTILTKFPSDGTIKLLRSDKITYIVIHKAEYDALVKNHFMIQKRQISSGQDIIQRVEEFPSLKLVRKFGNDYVYKIK